MRFVLLMRHSWIAKGHLLEAERYPFTMQKAIFHHAKEPLLQRKSACFCGLNDLDG